MEFELLRLGIDIYELEGGTLTIRRLRNIIDRLDSESELAVEMSGITREQRAWKRPETWLLANIQDCLQALDYHFVLANSEQGKGPKHPPKPIPRPGAKAEAKEQRKRLGASLPMRPPPPKQ